MSSSHPATTSVHTNKKALWDYEILESFEAGIVLSGCEVKSIRAGEINLKGAWVSLQTQRPMLLWAHIGRYRLTDPAHRHEAKAERKLLLKKRDITRLNKKLSEKGLSLIPTEVYLKGSLIKVKVALGRGRKQFDKKHLLKERTVDRELDRAMKYYVK